jgi:serine/threonine-protein kinase
VRTLIDITTATMPVAPAPRAAPSLAPRGRPFAVAVRLPRRYRIVRLIALSARSSIWAAEDRLLDRLVAVKFLHAYGQSRAAARLRREARAAARVSYHPHIATVYDLGEHDGHSYIVMEHFRGTVARRLGLGPVSQPVALRWLREAASALDVVHAAGLVHRDIKPSNLLLDSYDRLALADFGIATLSAHAALSCDRLIVGTAAYMSPEQASGREATPASDRYALAAVAFELLSGRRPFAAESAREELRRHAEATPPAASALSARIPRTVDTLLRRGLAKDPAARPSTSRILVGELQAALRA